MDTTMTTTGAEMEPQVTSEEVGSDLASLPVIEFLDVVTEGGNLYEYLSEEQLNEISQDVRSRYDDDKGTMSEWLTVMEKGLDLAKMSKTEKNYPYQGASNIQYPVIINAAMQYNARAYPAIVPSGDPVRCAVNGSDVDGMKAARGDRVAKFSSYQLKTGMKRWERDTDRMTFIGPIVGTVFRKYWYDPATQTQKSRLCEPGKIILSNAISDLSEANSITEEFNLYPYEITERQKTGWYADADINNGMDFDENKVEEFIEQICRIDLDDDGYPEPYVVTVHVSSGKVLRVSSAFDADDVRLSENDDEILYIEPNAFYVDYHFLPSFDGSFLGHGFGALLGDISDTINTILNQLMDAGHYSSMGGGWIGAKDFKVKGGTGRFAPGEWKVTTQRGDDIRKGIVPMTFPEPSAVLFQLLGVMLDAARDISSTSNIMTGDASNANMPVGTVMALIEQGLQVFTASYKRVYVSLKKEFALLCRMNARYLSPETYSAFFDDMGEDGQPVIYNPADDFNLSNMDVTPVADHKSVTDMQRMAKAQMLFDMAEKGLIDKAEAISRVLEAANVEDIEALMPQPDPMAAQIAEMQFMSAQMDLEMKSAEIGKKIAETQSEMAKAAKDVASAESEEMGRNLDLYMKQLTMMKARLDDQRTQNNGQRAGGMAGASGNGMAAGLGGMPS